jgi:GWxTD domain-containing protein
VRNIIILFSYLCIANIGNAQNRLSESVINNSAQITELRILGNDSLPIPYNFCDSTVSFCFVQIKATSGIALASLEIKYTIRKKNKSQKILLSKTLSLNNKLSFHYISEKISLDNYATGNYILQVILLNNNKQIDSAELLMQRWNSQNTISNSLVEKNIDNINPINNENISDINNSFVEKYSSSTILNYLKACLPIANHVEQNAISILLQTGADSTNKQFFYNFWETRNSLNPQKAWQDYATKLNYVASNYGGGGSVGYATDRGRIYLKYGKPARSESVSNEQGTLPYEVWQYDEIINGKEITFLFAQSGMLGSQMSLLHSTMPGELFNPYWVNTLVKDTEKTDYRIYNYLPAPTILNQR